MSARFLSESEKQQLLLLASLAVFIPVTWVIFSGWLPNELIPQGDHLDLGMIYQRDFTRLHGDWTRMIYWPGLGGGVRVHDVTGSMPITQLLALLQVDLVTFGNIVVMTVQLLFAYLCVAATTGLASVLFDEDAIPAFPMHLMGIMFAFLPFLAWRITHGHEIIIVGLFVLLSFTVLFLNEISAKRSIVSTLVCLVALCHAFQSNSFQLIYYSVLFGGPIFIALAFAPAQVPLATRLRWFLVPALVFLAALLISLPKFYGMFVNALGDESSRTTGFNVVYSYTTATWMDWLTSIPWTSDFIPADTDASHVHETNYPLGPLVLALILVRLDRRVLILTAGLLVSLLMALILSLDAAPLSTAMINYTPLLESFRVPARSILPVLLMASLLGSAVLLHRTVSAPKLPVSPWWFYAGVGCVVITFGLLTPWINDILLVVAILTLAVFRDKINQPAVILVVTMFTGGAIAAFNQRAPAPLEQPTTEASFAPIRNTIHQQAPELTFPLNRLHTNLFNEHLKLNSHFFWDVSSLSSYWFPLERYSNLVMALEGLPYRPTHSLFQNQPGNQGFDALNRLFNVGWKLNSTSSGYEVTSFGAPYGAAWVSTRIKRFPTWPELADELKSNTDRETLLLLDTDPKTQGIGTSDNSCQVIESALITPSEFPYEISLDVNGQCFLSVSMNYSAVLKATNQDGKSLRTFPAFGTLLGIVVDSDTRVVEVTPVATRLAGGLWIQICGLLLAAGLLAFNFRRSSA